MSSGLRDKLYWRQLKLCTPWHCFKKLEGGGYISLCGKHRIKHSGGQAIDRPAPVLRCGICDGREMERRGWEESGPERPDPRS